MEYARIYREFVADRRGRESGLARPFDRHHVLPRSLGGGDEAENIVRLSPSDHIFAHMLLAKIHGGKMVRAVYGMLHGKRYAGRRSRREYTWLRARLGEMASDAVRAAVARRGHGHNKGKAITEEAKAKMRATKRARFERVGHGPLKGYKFPEGSPQRAPQSPDHVAKRVASRLATAERVGNPCKGRKMSDETRAKMSIAARARAALGPNPMKGKKMPPEHGAKISATRIAKFAAIRQQRAISALSSLCGQ